LSICDDRTTGAGKKPENDAAACGLVGTDIAAAGI